jgi:hypothetical protein
MNSSYWYKFYDMLIMIKVHCRSLVAQKNISDIMITNSPFVNMKGGTQARQVPGIACV